MSVTICEIKEAVRALGLQDQPLIVHSSLKSFGYVEGGPKTVIDGLLAEGCTVMVPSFCSISWVAPPSGVRPERNAVDYDSYPGPQAGPDIPVYTPETNAIERALGAIPCMLMEYKDRVRGNHPIESFTAVGPLSRQLVEGQNPTTGLFAPFDALAEIEGWVVLMGVGLTRATIIHHAEQKAGRHPFIRWANGPDGKPMEAWLSGCSSGFGNLESPLSHLKREILVGESLWKVFPARFLLEEAAQLIRKDPQITHCSNPDCVLCNDAIAGGPVV
ncbi:MAG: AAC(3) family N-acetyltransferase [Armatimonadota bacterium]